MTRRHVVDAILFLPVMALLAALVFVAFWLVIRAGNAAMLGFTLAAHALGLPFPAAMVLGVFVTALAVYVAVPRLAVLVSEAVGKRNGAAHNRKL